jgi:hypothetical protein
LQLTDDGEHDGLQCSTERTAKATKTTAVVTTTRHLSSLPTAAGADALSTISRLELTTRAQTTPATTNTATMSSSTATAHHDCTAAVERELSLCSAE